QTESLRRASKRIQFGLHLEDPRVATNARFEGDVIMKRITAIALFILASMVSAGSASAQDNGVRATIPFDFTVGNKVLPSGTYTIKPEQANVVAIVNREKSVTVLSIG